MALHFFFSLLPLALPGVFCTAFFLPSRHMSIMGLRRRRPMGHHIRKRNCQHWRTFLHPAPRHLRRQRYGAQPPCQPASPAASQRRWLRTPATRDDFRGPEPVERVRQWRKAHPGYGRREAPKSSHAPEALPAPCTSQDLETQAGVGGVEREACQDACFGPPTGVMGRLAQRTGWS
jgi:hypothetical protein